MQRLERQRRGGPDWERVDFSWELEREVESDIEGVLRGKNKVMMKREALDRGEEVV